jgi:hypothetical protein
MTRRQFILECRQRFGSDVMDKPTTRIEPCNCGRSDCAGWRVQAEATLEIWEAR